MLDEVIERSLAPMHRDIPVIHRPAHVEGSI